MAKNIMPKVVEPIMAVTPKQSQYIDYNVSLKDFMVLTCFSIFQFLHKLKIQLEESSRNTTQLGESSPMFS